MVVYWIVAALVVGLTIAGIVILRASRVNTKKIIRDMLMIFLVPAMLFIAFIEFIVVPSKGAQYAASLYVLFLVCWMLPANILLNLRLKKYRE